MVESLAPSSEASCVADARSKELGAYYTERPVARFLLDWAISSASDTVLDPSFGGGVFLEAAYERVRTIGGDPCAQVLGIELDDQAFTSFRSSLFEKPNLQLRQSDFFDVDPLDLGPVTAVVGNPPYIRYQRFTGLARERALLRAKEVGVNLPRLTSSWAPFLVHATRFVAPGGRLGMVLPAELAYATYARPVIEYLRRSFRGLRILTFRRRLFRQLSEDTLLLLADGKGYPFDRLEFTELAGVESLAAPLPAGICIESAGASTGMPRLAAYLLPPRARELYAELSGVETVRPLGTLVSVGIGYVTGDNDFFHLDRATAQAYGIPDTALQAAVRSISDFDGLRYIESDWEREQRSGRPNLLLRGDRADVEQLSRYLDEGVSRGVNQRYKCRVRSPWFVVPHVHVGDAFVSCMSGDRPKFVLNHAYAVAPNTLHVAKIRPGHSATPEAIASAWRTSLTGLSCELEGHALGGGLLKLEPVEARRVLLPLPMLGPATYHDLAGEIDQLERSGELEVARALADDCVLRRGLGLPEADIQAIQYAWRTLHDRRLTR
jgi:adenine-specific DNA-methyltransferase